MRSIYNRYKLTAVSKAQMARLIFAVYGALVAANTELDDKDKIEAACRESAEVLCGESREWGLFFVGGVGTGKSTMMRAIQQSFVWLVNRGHINFGEGLRMVSAKKIREAVNGRQWYENLCREPLLGIDDLGAEPAEKMDFGSVSTPVIDLLEYRYDHRLVTVLTSNLNHEQRKMKYGNRIDDRFNEMFKTMALNGKSHR